MANIDYQNRAATILKITRETSGKSQSEMAKLMGVTRQTINSWECGYTFPTFPDVILWFDILHLSGTIINDCCKNNVLDDIKIHAEEIIKVINTNRSTKNET